MSYENKDLLPEDRIEAIDLIFSIVKENRHIENCRRYPRSVTAWLLQNCKTVEEVRMKVPEADRLERDHSDFSGPGLSDPEEKCLIYGDEFSHGEMVVMIYVPYRTCERLVSQW